MHFKLFFAFLPFSSHFAMKKEEKREGATTDEVGWFFQETLESSLKQAVLVCYRQFRSEAVVLILP